MTSDYNEDGLFYQDLENNLKSYMEERDLSCGDILYIDGRIHRYSSRPNFPTKKSEWYIANWIEDTNLICTFGSWRTGEKFTYRSYEYTPEWKAKEKSYKEETTHELLIAAKEEKEIQQKAVKKLWNSLTKGSSNPYLEKKKLPLDDVKTDKDTLYVPLYDIDGVLSTLQKIMPTGEKRQYPGISTKGLLHILGNVSQHKEIFVVEGYATGLSLHLATSKPVCVAFSSSGLIECALLIKNRYPGVIVKLGADNDATGKKMALEWKSKIGDYIYFSIQGDFNDDWVNLGKEAIQKHINPSVTPKSFIEVINSSDKPPEMLNDFMTKGSFSIIYGAAGLGKSRIAMDLIFSLVLKEKLWWFDTYSSSKILLIDGEMTAHDLKERFTETAKRFSSSEQELDPNSIQLISTYDFYENIGEEINLFNPSHRDILTPLIQETDLVVLDNYRALTQSGNVDSYLPEKSAWKETAKWIKGLRNQGKSTLLLMHANKSGEYLEGINEIAGDADLVLKLQKPKGETSGNGWRNQGEILLDVEVHYSKARRIPASKQTPFRLTLLSERYITFGWKYEYLKP